MSFEHYKAARGLSLPLIHKAVLKHLASMAAADGVVFGAIGDIADDTGACERSVRMAIRALENDGFLVRSSSTYVIGRWRVVIGASAKTTATETRRRGAPHAAPPAKDTPAPRHHMPPPPAPHAPKVEGSGKRGGGSGNAWVQTTTTSGSVQVEAFKRLQVIVGGFGFVTHPDAITEWLGLIRANGLTSWGDIESAVSYCRGEARRLGADASFARDCRKTVAEWAKRAHAVVAP